MFTRPSSEAGICRRSKPRTPSPKSQSDRCCTGWDIGSGCILRNSLDIPISCCRGTTWQSSSMVVFGIVMIVGLEESYPRRELTSGQQSGAALWSVIFGSAMSWKLRVGKS